MINRFFDKIADICIVHYRRILILSAVLAVAAIAAASLLTFDPDLLNLIPQHNKQVNDFKKVLTQMGTIDYHIVVIELPKGHEASEYDALIEQIAKGYEQSKLIENVSYKVPNPFDLVEVVLPKAFLFLDPKDLDAVATKLSDEGIRESVARSRTLLQTPQGFAVKELVRWDPFNLLPVFLEKFKSAGSGFKIDVTSGFYQSTDHSTVLILTKPVRAAQNLPFSKQVMTLATQIENRAKADFHKSSPSLPLPKFEYTGGYAIAFDDSELIRSDVIANVLFSFFGVLALFLYAFRRWASLGYAAIPMTLGLLVTFGVAGVVYGTLSSASAGFAALLAGLGIDFITVMYGRYVDERNRGASMPDAIHTIMRSTLPAVTIAAVTTAGTFYAFLATDFRGMTQLGFLTGTGILLFLLSVTFVLPALIVAGERDTSKKPPRLYLHSFGSQHLIEYSVRRPMKVIIAWVILIAVSAALATQVHFSDNIQDLRSKGNRGMNTQQRLTKKFGQSFDFMMFVVEGRDLNEAMRNTYAAAHDLDALVREKKIASYQSISTFLPPVENQMAVIERLQRGRSDAFSPERIEKTFRAALVENGFRPQIYDDYLNLFRQTLQPAKPVSLDDLHSEDLQKLTTRYLKKTPTGYMSVIYVYPTGGVWPRNLPAGLHEFSEKHPHAILTGVNLVSETLRNIIRADAIRATLLGFVLVLVLMFASFRRVRLTMLSFVPFIAGAAGMFGFMALLNLDFNFMNIFVGLMIIGSGTDYAIYMMERFLEDHEAFTAGAAETGKAVVMAALTTIVGFGSFAMSHYPGLRSIGYASTFGVALSGLAAISLLPAILTLWRPRRRRVSPAE